MDDRDDKDPDSTVLGWNKEKIVIIYFRETGIGEVRFAAESLRRRLGVERVEVLDGLLDVEVMP